MSPNAPDPVSVPPPPPPPPSAGGPPQEERQWAMFAHLSALAGGLLTSAIGGWGFFLGPLVIWLMKKDSMPFVADQAKESLNFNITVSAIFLVLLVLSLVTLGIGFIITLPMILPALISGWLLAFTLSLDDLVIASFVAGPGATTLPMLVFASVRMGVNPEINALATLILLVVGIIGMIAWWFMSRAEKQRIKEIQRAARG